MLYFILASMFGGAVIVLLYYLCLAVHLLRETLEIFATEFCKFREETRLNGDEAINQFENFRQEQRKL